MTSTGFGFSTPLLPVPPNIAMPLVPFVRPQSGRLLMLGGNSPKAGSAPTAGSLRMYPIYLPYSITYASLGFNVTAAGAAGCTIIPAAFSVDGFGAAAASLLTGAAAVAGDAITQANTAQSGTLPAGFLWVGGLMLSGGAVPSITSLSGSDHDARGSAVPTDNATSATTLAFQSGLGAVPAVFGGTYQAGAAPMLYVTPA